MFFVYVIESLSDGSRYIGYSKDPQKRLAEHNRGKTKSMKSKIPYRVVNIESFDSKTDARKREIQLKKSYWHRKQLFDRIDQNTAPSSSG